MESHIKPIQNLVSSDVIRDFNEYLLTQWKMKNI